METITGIAELDRKLKLLATKIQRKVGTAAIRSAMGSIKSGVRQAGKKHIQTGVLDRSIGARFKRKKSDDTFDAKIGIGVGQTKKKGKMGRHIHLVVLGSKPRWTGAKEVRKGKRKYLQLTGNKRAYRGVMPKDDFVNRGYQNSKSDAQQKIINSLTKGIEREMAKA